MGGGSLPAVPWGNPVMLIQGRKIVLCDLPYRLEARVPDACCEWDAAQESLTNPFGESKPV